MYAPKAARREDENGAGKPRDLTVLDHGFMAHAVGRPSAIAYRVSIRRPRRAPSTSTGTCLRRPRGTGGRGAVMDLTPAFACFSFDTGSKKCY